MEDRVRPRSLFAIAGTAVLVVAGLVVVWYAAEVLLLAFIGILIALLLRGVVDWITARVPIPAGVAFAAVILGIGAVLLLAGWLLADNVAAQFAQLVQDVPRAVARLTELISQYAWGRLALSWIPDADALSSVRTLGRATGILSMTLGTTIGAVANVIIVAFIALYVAMDPGVYARGVVLLVPIPKRERAREVLDVLGHTLRRWLAGKLIGMAVIGVFTGAGLWIIGVPLALTLGLLAGVLNFIPYLGPLLSFIPALLLALTDSAATMAWVLGLYAVVQFLESYLLTPLVDRRSVALPPALTIVAQVTLGALVGILGLVLASPLTAALLVLVRMLYVEGTLGDTAYPQRDAGMASAPRARDLRR